MMVPYTNLPMQGSVEWPELSAILARVILKGNFILGEEVQAFEREFADFCGVKHAIGVGNGTDSLILCLRLLGIGRGDEVITAPNSWISSASAVALVGAKPVFADVGPDQLIDPEEVADKITKKTKAIIPVHLTGRMADMFSLTRLSEETGIPLIEDAAQAVGAKRGLFAPGLGGNLCSYSLHPLKNLNACGDAGIITTNNDDFASELRLLRNHGLKDRDHVVQWGFNSRLDELQAAILRYRLKYLRPTIERRRQLARIYNDGLEYQAHVTTPEPEREQEYHTYHVYVIQCEKRDQLKEYLAAKGIETKIHYPIPIHMQEVPINDQPGDFPVTEDQSQRILSLPINQYLSDMQVRYVVENIKAFYER